MTSKKSQQAPSEGRLAAKKAAVLGASSARTAVSPARRIIAGVCILAVAGIAILLFTHSGPKNKTAAATPISPVGGELVHEAALFADGQARHFVLETDDGVGIRYFVLRTADGTIRTAFDACDACWQAGKGYVQDGDVMICRNCGMRFPSGIIGELRGGCNPTPLASEVRQGNVVIRLDTVLEGRRYFDIEPGSGTGRGMASSMGGGNG